MPLIDVASSRGGGDDRAMRSPAAGWLSLLLAITAVPADAQGPRTIRVAVDVRQSVEQGREVVQGSGGVINTQRGGLRPRAGGGLDSTERKIQRSTGIFTLVQDGGEATLTVTTRIPAHQVAVYQDHATGIGYLAAGVVLRDVGTSLRVQAGMVGGNRIRVRLTPRISYLVADGSGSIEFTEAVADLVVSSGRPVVLGGATSRTHAVLRQLLGAAREHEGRDTTVVLTATVQ
jgi:hypothetical protein